MVVARVAVVWMWRRVWLLVLVTIVLLEVLCMVAGCPRVLERWCVRLPSGSSNFGCVGRIPTSVVALLRDGTTRRWSAAER